MKQQTKPDRRTLGAADTNTDQAREIPRVASEETRLAERLKRLRMARRMTLEQLAERVGLSKGYLSKIENARQSPPIATLSRIARVLETDVGYFLLDDAANETERVSVVRANERRPSVRGATEFGYEYMSLAHKRRFKQMEPFVFRFPKESQHETRFEHEGEEFLFVLSGTIEFEIGGPNERRTWVLEPGDSIYFDSTTPHRGRSLTDDATALVVVLNPGHAP